jgi:hypothetical protein
MKQETCEQRIEWHLSSTLEDVRVLWDAYCQRPIPCPDCEGDGCEGCEDEGEVTPDEDGNVDGLGNIWEYGLSFDYVEGDGTESGFFRWQLSWGGPSSEFRFFTDPGLSCYRVQYAFLDWFDGATRTLTGDDRALLLEIWDWFEDCGSARNAYEEATA